jgi:hypothetical protein
MIITLTLPLDYRKFFFATTHPPAYGQSLAVVQTSNGGAPQPGLLFSSPPTLLRATYSQAGCKDHRKGLPVRGEGP